MFVRAPSFKGESGGDDAYSLRTVTPNIKLFTVSHTNLPNSLLCFFRGVLSRRC